MNMLGLCSGVAFAYYANSSPTTIWLTFGLLTLVHVVANYFAVRSLQVGWGGGVCVRVCACVSVVCLL